MNAKTFIDSNQKDLIIKSRKYAIIFENDSDKNKYDVQFHFDKEQMNQIIEYIINECNYAWSGFTPKEANNLGADYFEYYDRDFDTNGYLRIYSEGLSFERPINHQNKLYQLNKVKAQSFVYDLLRHQGKEYI